ncbi:MAG TPA: Ig-like domain repeat protein [Terriglobales bacterium]
MSTTTPSLRPCGLRLAGMAVCVVSLLLTFVPLAIATNASPTVTFLGVPSAIGTGGTFYNPMGIAVDAFGDVFVVDKTTHQVSELMANPNGVLPASPTIQTIFASLGGDDDDYQANFPRSMVIDPLGDLFISDASGLWEITSASGYTAAMNVSNAQYFGLAIDVNGNLFAADNENGNIVEFAAPNYSSGSNVLTGLSSPIAVAVDANDDLFVSNSSGSAIVEFVNSNGTYGSAVSLATLTLVDNMTVDASGDLIVPDRSQGVFIFPAFTNYTSHINLDSADTKVNAVAMSPMGNIVMGFSGPSANANGGVEQLAMMPSIGDSSLGTTTAASLTLPFKVASGITISSISMLTLGAANLDFKNDGSSTCSNTSTNTSCNLVVDFVPTAPGLRRGAVVVTSTDTSSNTYTTMVPIYAMSDAPQQAVLPATESVLAGSTGIAPFQTAIDGAGNIYEVEYNGKHVYKIPPGGGAPTTIDLSSIAQELEGIAVDGAGNLYVSDWQGQQIISVSAAGGPPMALPVSGAVPGMPMGLAMDMEGNLYVADWTNQQVEKIAIENPGTPLVAGVAAVVPVFNAQLGNVWSVAVDGFGDVFAGTDGAGAFVMPPGGFAFGLGEDNLAPFGVTEGIATDGFGNLYIADSTNNLIVEETFNFDRAIAPKIGVSLPNGVMVDPAGRIYISDYYNQRIVVEDPTKIPPSAPFASTNAGQESVDSPQVFSLINLGDQNLTFAGITYPTNFPQDPRDENGCSVEAALTAGSECDFAIDFDPTTSGNLTGDVQFTDNNLNAIPVRQSIPVSGTGIASNTVTTLQITPNPAATGQPVYITATVSPAPVGEGAEVIFLSDGVYGGVGVLTSGQAVLETNPPAGAYTISAVFGGSEGYNSSSSAAQTLVVNNQVSTSTAITSVSPSAPIAGQSVTFTATVAPAPTGRVLGTVNFYNGQTLLGTAPVVPWGTASITVSGLTAGTVNLAAVYSGTYLFAPSTSLKQDVVVSPAPTPTAITLTSVSPNPPTAGQSATFSAVVTPAPEAQVRGTVSFYNGSALLGTAAVNVSGAASLMISDLTAGNLSVTAVYSGTVGYGQSTSSPQGVVVNPETVATAIALTSVSPDPPVAEQSATLTATIAPAPTGQSLGTVSFYNGSALLGTTGVGPSGNAMLITSTLAEGTMSVTAKYSGAPGFAQSTSSAKSVVVGPPQTSTTISLTASPNPVYAGQPLTLTATIIPAPSGSFPGTVNYYKGSVLLGSATVNSAGVAAFTTTTLPSGDDDIIATYSGNSGFASSSSVAVSQTIKAAYGVSVGKTEYSVASGGSLQISVSVPAIGGNYSSAVTMSASGLPDGATATFNPASVTPGTSGATTVLTVKLAASSAAALTDAPKDRRRPQLPAFAFAFGAMFGAVLLPLARPRRSGKPMLRSISIAVLLLGTLFVAGCGSNGSSASSSGGGSSNPVQSGSYALTITGTSGSLHPSTTVTLAVQ